MITGKFIQKEDKKAVRCLFVPSVLDRNETWALISKMKIKIKFWK